MKKNPISKKEWGFFIVNPVAPSSEKHRSIPLEIRLSREKEKKV